VVEVVVGVEVEVVVEVVVVVEVISSLFLKERLDD